MTPDNPIPPALRRALGLFSNPPPNPDAANGYLDALAGRSGDTAAAPTNTGAIQALWSSTVGSMLYDNVQDVSRRLLAWQYPRKWLDLRPGATALDVGCGPGPITASLADGVGPDGLALGIDISEPMLARAVRGQSRPQAGFLRADAQQLPLRDDTVDAVVSIAVLQLLPDPAAAIAEMTRVLRPGGRLVVMAPTVGPLARFWRLLPAGARAFDDDELGDILDDHGFANVRTKTFGTIQWVRGTRG